MSSSYQFCRISFVLTKALATFLRLMDKLFNGCNFVFKYLDDILIASGNFKEHVCDQAYENRAYLHTKFDLIFEI